MVFMLLMVFVPLQSVYADDNFIIEDYGVDIKVNEDDTYDVTETISILFLDKSHGIYRKIPRKNTVIRDGETGSYYAMVTDFKVLSGQICEEYKDNKEYTYKIGHPSRFADERTTYQISYKYNVYGDHLKNADEFYFNLIGSDWEAQAIEHASFNIQFPKEIDIKNVGIKTGDDVRIPFESYDNAVVKGETDEDTINGLTIRAVLPDGYFSHKGLMSWVYFILDNKNILLMVIAILLLILGVIIWVTKGIDPKIIETVEFYPPSKLSSAEVGFLCNGYMCERHVISMFLALAEKGFIKIEETTDKKGKPDFIIRKVKKYDGYTIGERTLLDEMFQGTATSVRLSLTGDEFQEAYKKIKERIERKYENSLYDKDAEFFAKLIFWGACIIFMISGFLMVRGINFAFFVIPVFGLFFIKSKTKQLGTNKNNIQINKIGDIMNVISPFLSLIFMGVYLVMTFRITIYNSVTNLDWMPYLCSLGVCSVLAFLSGLCEKRTQLYTQLLGKIRGYRNFLMVTEKNKLELLVKRDPEYFYKSLAYAYSMGITDAYVKNFEPLIKEPPQWYVSPHLNFNICVFGNSLNGMTDAIPVPTTVQGGKSSGFGGGSFSGGGGFGGGGGGSW